MRYCLIVLVLAWGQAGAGEWNGAANFTLASHHFDNPDCDRDDGQEDEQRRCAYVLDNGYNETNPGLLIEFDREPTDWRPGEHSDSSVYLLGGVTKASFGEWIGVLGGGYKFLKYDHGHACIEGGVSVNYHSSVIGSICGVIGPVKINYIPNPGGSDSILASIRFRF